MRVLFAFAAVLLLCGSMWLVAVRLSSSSLRGLGWLSGAAALSSGGLALAADYGHGPLILSVVLASELMLLANVLIELALLELLENEARTPSFNLTIVAISTVLMPFFTYEHNDYRYRTMLVAFLMMLQAGRNACLLWSRRKKNQWGAFLYTFAGLCSLFCCQLARVVIVGYYWAPNTPLADNWYQNFTLAAYLLNSLWIVSGFFWLATLQLTAKLEDMAGTDPLTRLANRRVFREWMQRELLRSLRTSVPFSLLVIDLDHFKRINDTYGHSAGDEILRTSVERMQDSVRGIDVLGRWGGEEFVALLPRSTVEAAELVAERIRKNMELPFKINSRHGVQSVVITVSLGVTSYRGGDDTIDEMFDRADAALYGAKDSGRNCILSAA
ncbi:MAG: GGDEF domain-containing protein [Terriglobus sp.]